MAAVAECLTLTCRTCGELKPAGQMAVDHGKASTQCKACRYARQKLLRHARGVVYPCTGCEQYQACVKNWTPCDTFRAWVEAAC